MENIARITDHLCAFEFFLYYENKTDFSFSLL